MQDTNETNPGVRVALDSASFHACSKHPAVEKRKDKSCPLHRGRQSFVRRFGHAALSPTKPASKQMKRLGRWLRSMPPCLLAKFSSRSKLLIFLGLHSFSILFLGLSILETLNSWPDVSWKPYAGFIAFAKAAYLIPCPSLKKMGEAENRK